MKKIGRQTCILAANNENPRNGEGAFIRLNDGSVMYAYSRYTSADDNGDHAPAEIAAIYSRDEGETWSSARTLFPREEYAANNMCVSLLNMKDGSVGLFYLCKFYEKGLIMSKVMLRRSYDDGKTWTEAETCADEKKYFVLENDRVTKLKSGRIIIPLNEHSNNKDDHPEKGTARFYCSDDEKHWYDSGCAITSDAPTGLQETGIYQLNDGRLWAFSRTDRGRQFDCFSDDDAKTWTEPAPNAMFTSPCSPMSVKRMTDFSVAVFNPVSFPAENPYSSRTWGRTPLILAVSRDEFGSADFFTLEDDPENGYCYTALFEGKDYFLAAYYHSCNGKNVLTSNKILKVSFSEIFSPGAAVKLTQ